MAELTASLMVAPKGPRLAAEMALTTAASKAQSLEPCLAEWKVALWDGQTDDSMASHWVCSMAVQTVASMALR